MRNDMEQIIKETLGNFPLLSEENIPNIELYMDQVTTLMDKYLSGNKRFDEDKVLTKTMINNYAKNNLLPPPNKKKYSKEHVIVLIFIYYFKNVLSINDIDTLLSSVRQNYFQSDGDLNMVDVYAVITDMILKSQQNLTDSVLQTFESVSGTFSEVKDAQKRDDLQLFAFLSLLCSDIYRRKQLIETILDSMKRPQEEAEQKK